MDSNKVVKPLKKEFVRSYGYEWEGKTLFPQAENSVFACRKHRFLT